MIRSQTWFVLAVVVLAAAVTLLGESKVLGQIISGATSKNSSDSYPGATLFINLTSTNTSGVTAGGRNFERLSVTGDWDYSLPRTAGNGGVITENFLFFSVGNVPVEIRGFQLAANAKWVNGGGNANDPTTEASVEAFLFEALGGAPNVFVDPQINVVSVDPAANLTGNGFQVYGPNTVFGNLAPFVLAARRNYYLEIDGVTDISVAAFRAFTPSITVTNEFGGAFGQSFTGYDVSFFWVAVPEPSTEVLALCAAVGLSVSGLLQRARRA
ncbi:MAG: hypothetical protein HY288_06370 [Planctomycetia bacterium]|nr:hypothetical protein [Planctomycetia bacterium]